MLSVLPPHLWQWLWFLDGCLDFPCCDPVGGAVLSGGHSLVGVACHHGILVPSVPSCCIWSNGNHMWGSLLCQLGAVMCSWGSPWRVQMVCDHCCCGWCGLLATCPGRLCPQVWSCRRLVPRHAELHSGSL